MLSKSQSVLETYSEEFLARKVVDPVWLAKEYPPKVYSVEEAIIFHSEFAQEAMLNNMHGLISAKILLDMSSRKKVIK
jgi:hypothetical protein